MKAFLRSQNSINLFIGWCLYPLGDLIGQLLLGKFSGGRLLVMTLMGGLVYRYEIPLWFKWLDSIKFSKSSHLPKILFTESNDSLALSWVGRTLGAMLYFNPLWIARHVALIQYASDGFKWKLSFPESLSELLKVGVHSFLTNLPISLVGNYIIQKKLPLKYRFAGSATLSCLLSVAYAVEYHFFK